MTPERWQHVKKIFDKAVLLNGEPRQQFLRKVCRGDEALLHEVTSLLLHESAGTGLLDGRDALQQAEKILAEAEGTLVGRKIGAYRLLKKIGAGGMGTVYLAEQQDADFKMQVALKVIKRGMDTDEIVARFQNERQILAALDHPNIARLFFAGTTDDGLPYFAMEFVDGKPLTAFCDANRYSVEKKLRLFLQVCHAVHHAHTKAIVHRDLKPSNILITPKGELRLLDFGIAKLLRPSTTGTVMATLTRAGQKMMTPEYACPEQVTGKKITPASDVYALGVLLSELLTGSLPYVFENLMESTILRVVAETQPAKPSEMVPLQQADDGQTEARTAHARPENRRELRRKLRGDLDNIILKCLRKEPERRYPNAGALADDLQRYLKNRPVRAMPDSLAYRTNRLLRRKKKTILWSLLIAAAMASIPPLYSPIASWLNPPSDVVFEVKPRVAHLEINKTHEIVGTLLRSGLEVARLPVHFSVFSGPNKGIRESGFTDAHSQFKFAYTGRGGLGIDSIRVSGVLDDTTLHMITEAIWHPAGTLFGPLGGPIGKPEIDGGLSGGINCDGFRFSASLIEAHGYVRVERITRDQLAVRIYLKDGDPNFIYDIEIFEAAESCPGDDKTRTGVQLEADHEGNGYAEAILQLPYAPPEHHVLGDSQGSEAMIVVLDFVSSTAGGDRFTTDPIPLPAFSGNSAGEPADAWSWR